MKDKKNNVTLKKEESKTQNKTEEGKSRKKISKFIK